MTLDEAIKYTEELMEEYEKVADTGTLKDGYTLDELYCDDTEVIEEHKERCRNCAADYQQFAEWLRDYKRLKERDPCEDAISRQYLIDKAVSWDKHYADSERYVSLLDIQNAPPVITPQPEMKIGKWIIMDIEDCELFMAKCSECGVIVDSRMISKYLYCHYCGAKMVEPQESEEG